MVGAFRKEWPAADRNPRQAAGDRIVSRPEPLFGCPVARYRIARVLFCEHDGKLVLLHGFIKKTQRTPAGELGLAHKRRKEVT